MKTRHNLEAFFGLKARFLKTLKIVFEPIYLEVIKICIRDKYEPINQPVSNSAGIPQIHSLFETFT